VVRLLQTQAKKYNAALIIVTHDQRVKDHIPNQIIIGGQI
jgi:putative ABC transport system ATP-binding protein